MDIYTLLCKQAQELIKTDPWYVSALSNLSALLMDEMSDLNWAGFYLLRGNQLVVGPFQGKPACIHIPIGKGVCGTSLERNEMLNVPDVHQFPGHIACDSASNSELVIPIRRQGQCVAVLDLDSPLLNRFSKADENGLQHMVESIENLLIWE